MTVLGPPGSVPFRVTDLQVGEPASLLRGESDTVVVRDSLDAFDPEALAETLTDDCRLVIETHGIRYDGRDAITGLFAERWTGMKQLIRLIYVRKHRFELVLRSYLGH